MVEGGETTPKNLLMETTKAIQEDWPFLLTLLPGDLDASAKAFGALLRKRAVGSAEVLLRLAFAYGYCGLSLRRSEERRVGKECGSRWGGADEKIKIGRK